MYSINIYHRKMLDYDSMERYEYIHMIYTYMQKCEQVDSIIKEIWETKKRYNLSLQTYVKN